MKKRLTAVILMLALLITLVSPSAAFADNSINTLNSVTNSFTDWANCGTGSWTEENVFHEVDIPFSSWTNAGFGSWTEENGVLRPAEITDYTLLRLEESLGQNYTIDMDVRQSGVGNGWNTINIGFEVNSRENFTQSGLVLDLHNAGVARVITFADKDKSDGSLGSYDNPYGGNGSYTGTTDWFHVQIARAGSNYTVTVKDTVLTFKTGAFNGGYLVIGAVGSREVSYKNISITKDISFSEWENAGYESWTEENGVLKPTQTTEYSLLRFGKALGAYYTIDMDVRQSGVGDGWNTVNIGFDVDAGENFTQSGLVLDLHNAGVTRVITFADKDKKDGTLGSYDNPYGGNGSYTGTTDWFHVQIIRAGSSYTVTVKDTVLTFETDAFNGGYLVLGAIGYREVGYKNVAINIDHSYVDGVCEKCGGEDPDAVAAQIRSVFLRINEDINAVYATKLSDSCENPYMVFHYLDTDFTVTEYTVNAAGLYCFELSSIVPQCMGEPISATVYATKNGETVSDTVSAYSIKEYCASLLESTDDPYLITLLSDLLTYGAQAQIYTDYKTNELVTDGLSLTPSTFTELEKKYASFTGTAAADTVWTHATLTLSNAVAAVFMFSTDNTEGLTAEVSLNGRTQTFDTFEDKGNGEYSIRFREIKATEFDDTVTASFYRNGVQIGNAVNYSVNTYICSTQNYENANLSALVKALYNYGASATAYAASSGNLFAEILPGVTAESLFSFTYDGKQSSDLLDSWTKTTTYSEIDNGTLQKVSWTDPESGLRIVLDISIFDDPRAIEWVARLENTGSVNTPIVEDFHIADLCFDIGNPTLSYSKGTDVRADDFLFVQESLGLYTTRTFSPIDGRSTSGDCMPYFNLCSQDSGCFLAIGWSGQWEASFRRTSAGVHVTAGMQNTHFVLYPGESVRTPSFTLMKWNGTEEQSYGLWREHMIEEHTPKDDNGDVVTLPISAGAWGGDDAQRHLNTINYIASCGYDYDAYWVDAGWYGDEERHSSDQYGDEWFKNVGDWYHNTTLYPNGLSPVSTAANNSGMDFLLWFEPERAWSDSWLATEHPEWFLTCGETENTSLVFNMADSEARLWMTNFISQKIQEYGVDIYRQDFNVAPLKYWQTADTEDRQGITEMKYIEGLYTFMQGLVDQNPGLLLDNCAGGGRRLDYEMLSLALPLFRSDYQCFETYKTTSCQVQTDGLSHWVPLSGTCTQNRPDDTYSFRSNLSYAIQTPATGSASWENAMFAQFHSAQQYFTGEYYRVSSGDVQSDSKWYAYQMHSQETESGFVLAFRRENADNQTETLSIYVPDSVHSITFTDADTGASWTVSTENAENNHLPLQMTMSNVLSSKLLFYVMN